MGNLVTDLIAELYLRSVRPLGSGPYDLLNMLSYFPQYQSMVKSFLNGFGL
jgi:hypothetical protein